MGLFLLCLITFCIGYKIFGSGRGSSNNPYAFETAMLVGKAEMMKDPDYWKEDSRIGNAVYNKFGIHIYDKLGYKPFEWGGAWDCDSFYAIDLHCEPNYEAMAKNGATIDEMFELAANFLKRRNNAVVHFVKQGKKPPTKQQWEFDRQYADWKFKKDEEERKEEKMADRIARKLKEKERHSYSSVIWQSY